jgi:hypothetical protein
VTGLEEKHGHLLAQRRLVDAVEAPADADGDGVGDELGDEDVELLAAGDVEEVGDPALDEGPGRAVGSRDERAGEVVLSVWSSTKLTEVATPPIVMAVGSARSVPKAAITVPPDAGPDVGLTEKMILCENSDVLPPGSVAVTETRSPGFVANGIVTSIAASPEPSVVTCVEPMYVSP